MSRADFIRLKTQLLSRSLELFLTKLSLHSLKICLTSTRFFIKSFNVQVYLCNPDNSKYSSTYDIHIDFSGSKLHFSISSDSNKFSLKVELSILSDMQTFKLFRSHDSFNHLLRFLFCIQKNITI